MSDAIEARIAASDWSGARRLIQTALRREPDSHWLLARLGLTYYEERRYAHALRWSERALARAPRCPLVLWEYAGDLQQLGRHREALRVYAGLVRRGAESIARGPCGEGLRWAHGLVADSLYRQAIAYLALGQRRRARTSLEGHLALRGPRCASIYPVRQVRRELRALDGELNGRGSHAA
jgi:tetratricopeptide (TPR) repeat protein